MYTDKLIKVISKKTGIDISKFDIKELIIGMNVELEHGSVNPETDITGDDPEATFKIVMAHMNEMPNYYTKLKAMEDDKKEKITEYARRMRELAGLSEGNQSKSVKTIQEGKSSFEDGATFYAKDMTEVVKEYFNKNHILTFLFLIMVGLSLLELTWSKTFGFSFFVFRGYIALSSISLLPIFFPRTKRISGYINYLTLAIIFVLNIWSVLLYNEQ